MQSGYSSIARDVKARRWCNQKDGVRKRGRFNPDAISLPSMTMIPRSATCFFHYARMRSLRFHVCSVEEVAKSWTRCNKMRHASVSFPFLWRTRWVVCILWAFSQITVGSWHGLSLGYCEFVGRILYSPVVGYGRAVGNLYQFSWAVFCSPHS